MNPSYNSFVHFVLFYFIASIFFYTIKIKYAGYFVCFINFISFIIASVAFLYNLLVNYSFHLRDRTESNSNQTVTFPNTYLQNTWEILITYTHPYTIHTIKGNQFTYTQNISNSNKSGPFYEQNASLSQHT